MNSKESGTGSSADFAPSAGNVTALRPEQRFDNFIGRVLQIGVLLAAFFVLAGGITYVLKQNGPVPDYRNFHSEPGELRSVSRIIHAAFGMHPVAWIQFGLLVLIATPIARVALSVLAFLYERDWTYVMVTIIVLSALLYSLLGRHG